MVSLPTPIFFTRAERKHMERHDLFIRREQTAFDLHGGGGSAHAVQTQGVNSETGTLDAVLLGASCHLKIVPANSVSNESLRNGLCCQTELARAQHRMLEEQFARLGIRTHVVPAKPDMPDLAFTRDSTLMTPWGLLQLRPAAPHRVAEAPYVASIVRELGYPMLGAIDKGRVEGGDISMVRDGLIVIGCSGDRTDETGARAVADLFESRGWRAIVYRFDPHFLHLDTQFSMVGPDRALACTDVLDDGFLLQMEALGIELIPVSYKEARKLGCNVLSLGRNRVLSSAENNRVNAVLAGLGYDVIAADINQFTRCGGGIHCLTMPLARR